ncbi:hypothetical protein TrRE_jg11537 [Triparma retinervis]|uniref:Uncharacterized protein n=1 Tax=Triparma retinervis TaxID=2557542 RepID=A0A9W6ZM67_9STRA|nr:hypothetical protein TrRE_jg11537 [Triparma retinervis]
MEKTTGVPPIVGPGVELPQEMNNSRNDNVAPAPSREQSSIRKVTFKADTAVQQVQSNRVPPKKTERASWSIYWRIIILLVSLLPTIPYYYHFIMLDDFNNLLGVAGHSCTLFFTSLLLIANPWKPDRWWHELVEIMAGLNPIAQVALATAAEQKKLEHWSTSSMGYTVSYTIVVILLFRRRYRIQRMRLLKEHQLESLIMSTMPTVATGTAFSLAYLFTESFGCLLENGDGREMACYDVVLSNNAFAMVFVVATFIRIWVIPFATSIYTTENVVKFDFSLNEMMQFFTFFLGGILGLFMFASSTEIEDGSENSFFDNKYPLRRTIKLVSFSLLVVSVTVSFLPRKLSATSFGLTLKSMMSTRRSDELAKFYRYAVVWLALMVLCCTDIPLVFFAFQHWMYGDSASLNNVEEINMISLLAWPMLLVFNACYFFSRPKGGSTREKLLYLTTIIHPAMLVWANVLIDKKSGYVSNTLPIPFFACFLWLALKTRRHLANQGDRIISEHLNVYLLRILSTMPALLFLFAEGVGCAIRYNKATCETLIDSNLVVSLHLALGLVFITMFAFTMRKLTIRQIACLKGCRMHTVIQVVLVSINSIMAFLVFGMRPDIGDSGLYREDFKAYKLSEGIEVDDDEVNEQMKLYLDTNLTVISLLWGVCYILQGLHARTNYEEEKLIGEESANIPRFIQLYKSCNASLTKAFLKCLGSGGTDLSIAFLYKGVLFIFALIPFGLEIVYVWTGNPIWEWGSGSQFELMLLSIIITIFGNFTNKNGKGCGGKLKVRWFEALLCTIPPSILALGASSKLFYKSKGISEHTGGAVSDIVRLFLILGGMVIVYKSKTVSIRNLSRERKAFIVENRAFMLGIVGVFPPTLYVGAELTGCVIRNSFYLGTFKSGMVEERCGALFPGAKAVTMHIVILYFITVAFAPFEGRNITMKRVMNLELGKYDALQMFLFMVSSLQALTLYGTRHTGHVKLWQDLYLYAFYVCWFLNLLLETWKVMSAGERVEGSETGEGRRSSWIGRGARLSNAIFMGWRRTGDGAASLLASRNDSAESGAPVEMEKVDTKGWKLLEYARRQNSGRDIYKAGGRQQWGLKKGETGSRSGHSVGSTRMIDKERDTEEDDEEEDGDETGGARVMGGGDGEALPTTFEPGFL